MERHTLEVLDFPRIRDLLAREAGSPQGRDLCLALEPAPTLEGARRAQEELRSLAELEPVLGPPPTSGMVPVEEHLRAARREGICLPVEALLEVRDTVVVCQGVLDYLEDAAAEGSLLGVYAGQVRPLDLLVDRFERTFGPRGDVLDGASPELGAIRSELRRLRERARRSLAAVLRDADLGPVVQDDFITIRAGRYVIPLRTDFRGYLKGIVHDRSRTGATFFVEPMEVVEINNRIGAVLEEEKAEIRRILTALTREVGREAGAIRTNVAVAAHLDSLWARLALSRRLGAVPPDLTDRPELDLRQARHPLLALQTGLEVVPVDLRVGGGSRMLLITGANAGGKTVALKTAGLLALMARSGLFVPAAEGSRVGWFDPVFADIGDEQDLDRQLSTFTGHVARIREVIERSGPGTLALLDELGAGTDPGEGGALALAVLETLLEQGVTVVATTHLEGLKAFAYARPEAENAAVAFDPDTGRPLYRLIYGRAGRSNAIEVAERAGLPGRVVQRARAYLQGRGEPGAELLQDLERAREEARQAAERARELERAAAERLAEVEQRLREAEEERRRARREALVEARREIERARRELARQIRRFARGRASQQEAERAVRETSERLERALAPPSPPASREALASVEPGLAVRVVSLGREGRVVESSGAKAVVDLDGLRVNVALGDLAPARGTPARTPDSEGPRVRVDAARAPADVVIVGCRVEEALSRVDRALDNAILAGLSSFRIVHGRGTGALRRAVREHLEAETRVRALRPEQGDAATRVELA